MTTADPQRVFIPKSCIPSRENYLQTKSSEICRDEFNSDECTFSSENASDEEVSLQSDPLTDTSENLEDEAEFLVATEFRDSEDHCSINHPVLFDDVPRTPRRPFSILDPSSPSVLTEGLYVTVGVVALALGTYALYRFLKAH